MISKQHKLTTKEVNYLMRRKQSVYVDGYKILYCDQYPNNQYHQTGIQVSGKIHKHAVQRNIIRRAFYAAREDQIDKAVHNRYHKVFVVVHPEHCEFINQRIEVSKQQKEAKRSKKKQKEDPNGGIVKSQTAALNTTGYHLIHSTHQQLTAHFSSIIISALGKINQATSKTGSPRYNLSGKNSQSNPSQPNSMMKKTLL